MSALSSILDATRAECDALRRELPPPVAHTPRDVASLLRRGPDDPLRLLAEIKHRSPSAGPLSRALSVEARAQAYAGAGAKTISVLVDRAHFDGGYDHLARARAAVGVPLLAKGFTIDRVQVEAARRSGADAVLLIARILDDAALADLHAEIEGRGMTPIVEVVTDDELERALAVNARVLGVNARDLDTLAMDAPRAARVADGVPTSAVGLWFSGLGAPGDVAAVARRPGRRLDGALIGECLMRRDDPAPLLVEMVAAAAG